MPFPSCHPVIIIFVCKTTLRNDNEPRCHLLCRFYFILLRSYLDIRECHNTSETLRQHYRPLNAIFYWHHDWHYNCLYDRLKPTMSSSAAVWNRVRETELLAYHIKPTTAVRLHIQNSLISQDERWRALCSITTRLITRKYVYQTCF